MTLYADSTGKITGYFTVPTGIAAGTKLVQAYGAGGAYGEATFTGRGTLMLREVQYIPIINTVDPLAQTFMVDEDTMCCGTDLKFAAQGSTDCFVQLREVENGMPTKTVVARAVVEHASISTNEGTWTRATWTPVMLQKGIEYCVTVACEDSVMALRCAELGKYDAYNGKWMTAQPYMVGVMLSSSNNSTWTPDQYADMTFRLLQPTFNDVGYTRSVTLEPVSVTNCDYLTVLAAAWRPASNTHITFELTVPTTPTPTVYTVTEGQPILLPQTVTGTVTWRAILTGSAHVSPWLFRSIQLAAGESQTEGTYVSRAFAADSDGSTVIANCVASLPSPATLTLYAQTGVDGGGDPTWSSAMSPNGSPKLVSMIGGSWYERSYILTGLSGVDSTRIKLVMTGSAQSRPQVRDLQCIVKSS